MTAALAELDRRRALVLDAIRQTTGRELDPLPGQGWPTFHTPVEPCESCGRPVVAADGVHSWRNPEPVEVWEIGWFPSNVPEFFVLRNHARLHTPDRCREART